MATATPPAGPQLADETQIDLPNRDLVEQSARFSHAFLRWLGAGADGGLSYPRLRVLEMLHCKGPAKMRDLADELGLTARNLTTVADGLEADDLVRRVAHPTDRRATLLELTPDGRAAADSSLAPRLTEISRVFDVLPASAKKDLLRSFEALVAAMEPGRSPES